MERVIRSSVALSLITVLAGVGGCVWVYPIKRTALIPGVKLPARAGSPLHAGEVRLEAHANAVRLLSAPLPGSYGLGASGPGVGDPGVLIPDLELELSGYTKVGRYVELGLQGAYAPLAWSQPNVDDVLPFPDGSDASIVEIGPGLRIDLPAERSPLSFSLLMEVNHVTINEAVYVLSADDVHYDLYETQQDDYFLPNVAAQLTWASPETGPFGASAYVIVGAQDDVRNVGFDSDPTTLDDSTLTEFWAGYVGAGAELRYRRLRVGLAWYLPWSDVSWISFGPSASVTMGVALN